MSPEYAIDGLFSVKSDVFSFGVLVLEIVSGKKNRGFYHPDHDFNLLGHVSLKQKNFFLQILKPIFFFNYIFSLYKLLLSLIWNFLGMEYVERKQNHGTDGCFDGKTDTCIRSFTMYTSQSIVCPTIP
jgi:serine/threonine protein kinase